MKWIILLALALAVATPTLAAPSVGDPTALVRKLYANETLDQIGRAHV